MPLLRTNSCWGFSMKKIFSIISILFVATLAFAKGHYDYGCNSQNLCSPERGSYVCEDNDLFLHTYKTYFWSSKEDAEATQNDIETYIKKGWRIMRIVPTGNGCIVTFERNNR
jgi:hypothetical protein